MPSADPMQNHAEELAEADAAEELVSLAPVTRASLRAAARHWRQAATLADGLVAFEGAGLFPDLPPGGAERAAAYREDASEADRRANRPLLPGDLSPQGAGWVGSAVGAGLAAVVLLLAWPLIRKAI